MESAGGSIICRRKCKGPYLSQLNFHFHEANGVSGVVPFQVWKTRSRTPKQGVFWSWCHLILCTAKRELLKMQACESFSDWTSHPGWLGPSPSSGRWYHRKYGEGMLGSCLSSQPCDCPSCPAWAGLSLAFPGREFPAQNRKRPTFHPAPAGGSGKEQNCRKLNFVFGFQTVRLGGWCEVGVFFPLVFHL